MKSLEHAAAAAITPSPSLDVTELSISAAPGRLDFVADEVVAAAERAGGSATKGFPDNHRIGLLVDVPANREMEFRTALSKMVGATVAAPSPNETASSSSEKKSF